MKLRTFDSMSSVMQCFENTTSPMIKITAFGDIEFFKSKQDKLQALKNRKETEKFAIAWGGKWSTDVFQVNEEDIKEVLDKYNVTVE